MSYWEAITALQLGADMLGFVSEMPSGPGFLDLDNIASIINQLPRETKSILLTSAPSVDTILNQHRIVDTWGIQLVDIISLPDLVELRVRLPHVTLIQAIHITSVRAIKLALKYSSLVDMLLLDSGNPSGKKRTLGGTGKVHNWNISREICSLSPLPVFLAGGLNSENISGALSSVKPYGFDLCTGVRTGGDLDSDKLQAFFKKIETLT